MISLTTDQFLDIMIAVRTAILHERRFFDDLELYKDTKSQDKLNSIYRQIKCSSEALESAYDILKSEFDSHWPHKDD